MSSSSITISQLSALLGISEEDIKDLSKRGVIEKSGNGFSLIGSVKGYLNHLRKLNDDDTSHTQQQLGEHVGISERSVRGVCERLGFDSQKITRRQFRLGYIRDLREKAAGRGGDDQANLTKRRAEESAVNTAIKRLDYHERLGHLVAANDVAMVITDWCSTANREYRTGIGKLIGEIQSAFKIEIPGEMVENIVSPTTQRIQDHAKRLGRDLVEGGGDVYAAEDDTDGRMAD